MKLFVFILLMFASHTAYCNDSLSCKGNYDNNGKKNGVWLCKDSQGHLQKKERYKHGVLFTYIIYNSKGQMVETRNRKGEIRKHTPCGC
ncbi:MAG: hypothetical protein V4613_07065 [Bacteroidota bacterium]